MQTSKLNGQWLRTLTLAALCSAWATAGTGAVLNFNVSSGSWHVASSWSPAQVPTNTDSAYVANGYTAVITNPAQCAMFSVSGVSGGTLMIATGSLTGASGTSYIGAGPGERGRGRARRDGRRGCRGR